MKLLVVGVLLILIFWKVVFRYWQRDRCVVMLLVYMPFAGVVTLSMYPSPLPTLFKDFFFVIPAYIAFLLARKNAASQQRMIPASIILVMLAFTALVFVQMFNPGVTNWMVALIGAKVWLFYLPLIFLAFAMVKSREDLIKLLRLMVAIAWIPCGVGIVQWVASISFGYHATMEAFYGDAAQGATQNFTSFDVGGTFFRIPSTFTFVTQYFGYTLAMIVPAYALMKMDPSRKWHRFAAVTFWLVILASFLSGARAAYLFVPILLALIYLLEGNLMGVVKIAVILPLALLLVTTISGIDLVMMFNLMVELFLGYSEDIVKQGLLDAIITAPFGNGAGMNTGSARYAFDDPSSFKAFENYYAKAVYELGVAGLIIVLALFVILIIYGYRIHHRIKDTELRSCSAAILAFIVTMMLNSFKGWQIDLDPVNVYFWLFAGILLKLKYLTQYTLGKKTHRIITIPINITA